MPEAVLLPTLLLVCVNALMAWCLWYPIASGQFSMGVTAVVGLGAYTAGYLALHGVDQLAVEMVVAAVVGAVVSVPLGLISFRLTGFTYAIVTLGLAQSVQTLITNADWLGGAQGLTGVNPSNDVYLAAPILVAITAGYSWLVWNGPLGRAQDVLGSDELQARSLGTPTRALKIYVLMVAGLVGGATGAVLARYQGFIDPAQFGFSLLTELFAYVVLGGVQSFWGPFLGASTLTVALQILATAGTSRQILFGVLLVAVILIRRDGVLRRSQRLQQLRLNKLLRAAAGQRRTDQVPSQGKV